MAATTEAARSFITAVHGIRYQVTDVNRAMAFYTERLGFTVQHAQPPAFASVALANVSILLSGPGASGSRPMPSGQKQEPGGWNRVVLKVTDLPSCIAALKGPAFTFATRWKQVRAGNKFKWRIRTGIR